MCVAEENVIEASFAILLTNFLSGLLGFLHEGPFWSFILGQGGD